MFTGKKSVCLIALLSFMLISATAFGQSASASLSGTVTDATNAFLPGAAVTALNVETGIETRTTANNSGIYNFPSLQAGTYNIIVEAPGFQRKTSTDVRLRASSQNNLNFGMSVAGTITEVEVSGTAENMILEAGSSTGTVLQEDLVAQLPVFTGNVLELVNIMGGVVTPRVGTGMFDNPITSGDSTQFAGVSAANINVVRDGVSVNEVRYGAGKQWLRRFGHYFIGIKLQSRVFFSIFAAP